MDWDWGSMISWGWGVIRSWGWVVWLSFWVNWGTFVFDISDETIVVISSVCYSLYTAIGKVDLVRSGGSFAIRGFLGVEVSLGVVISNSVLESVWGRCVFLWMSWGMIRSWGMIWCWSWGMIWSWYWSSWESCCGSEKSGEGDEGIHDEVLLVFGSNLN